MILQHGNLHAVAARGSGTHVKGKDTCNAEDMQAPVGELKKLVSLVDRSAFDESLYPADCKLTKFQTDAKPYHNYTEEIVSLPFSGRGAWGQRITFDMPWPWQHDFLHSITFRFKPASWLKRADQFRIGPDVADYVPTDPASFWIWANSLGTAAIALAEMEVNGVIVEQISGDWIHVWKQTHLDVTRGIATDDMCSSQTALGVYNFRASDDGYIYCPLPFWFSKFKHTAFPLLSCKGPHAVRFHITLRPFDEVVRKLSNPKTCDESPLGWTLEVRDYSLPFRKMINIVTDPYIPDFEMADVLCTVSHLDNGELRKAYLESPHEILMNPVTEITFAEPLNYTVNTSETGVIRVQLPLTAANGPIKQILFFLRRNAVVTQSDWTNYSAVLAAEADPVWNPVRPLLKRAQLQIGTATWADEDERWWRSQANLVMPGGVRGYGTYIYGYNFAEQPAAFDPSGSANASRTDMRLNLTVMPPGGTQDKEWQVVVYVIGHNWMRFENGLANMVFMD